MSEKIEGYSYQEHEPTPEKPVEIKVLNLFEVNGIQYTDNIPDNMNIGITKEQYCEYLQLQQENQQLKKDKFILQARLDRFETIINKVEKFIKEEGCYEEDTKTFCDDVNYDALPKILQILDKAKEN